MADSVDIEMENDDMVVNAAKSKGRGVGQQRARAERITYDVVDSKDTDIAGPQRSVEVSLLLGITGKTNVERDSIIFSMDTSLFKSYPSISVYL